MATLQLQAPRDETPPPSYEALYSASGDGFCCVALSPQHTSQLPRPKGALDPTSHGAASHCFTAAASPAAEPPAAYLSAIKTTPWRFDSSRTQPHSSSRPHALSAPGSCCELPSARTPRARTPTLRLGGSADEPAASAAFVAATPAVTRPPLWAEPHGVTASREATAEPSDRWAFQSGCIWRTSVRELAAAFETPGGCDRYTSSCSTGYASATSRFASASVAPATAPCCAAKCAAAAAAADAELQHLRAELRALQLRQQQADADMAQLRSRLAEEQAAAAASAAAAVAAASAHAAARAEALDWQQRYAGLSAAALGHNPCSVQHLVQLGMTVVEAQARMVAAVGCSSLEALLHLPYRCVKAPRTSNVQGRGAVVVVEDPVLAATLAARAARRAASAQAGDAMLTSAPAAPLRGGRAEVVAQGAELAASLPGSLGAELPTSARLVLKILPFSSTATAAVVSGAAPAAGTAGTAGTGGASGPSLYDVIPQVTADALLSALLPGEYVPPLLWGFTPLTGPCAHLPATVYDQQLVLVYAHQPGGDLVEHQEAAAAAAQAAAGAALRQERAAEAALAAVPPVLDACMESLHLGLRKAQILHGAACDAAERERVLAQAAAAEAAASAAVAARAEAEAALAAAKAATGEVLRAQAQALVAGARSKVAGMCRVTAKLAALDLHVDDVKPENYIIGCSGGVKGIDSASLRRAQRGHGCEARSDGCGTHTPAFCSPEQALRCFAFSGPPADVWGIGSGARDLLSQLRRCLIQQGGWRLLRALDAELKASPLPDVVSACCQRDPAMRLTAGEVLRMLL
ncbi:hypothetical protein HYH03_006275 [Edaphochlamys debaryana]|uniref:Uncharacterized protein n=1 Tax=Edaphochlamys debaryana TaxID=47281 RepID=A0A835Y422_9CHLO|nr:hypothetical protein HYH03_006275 [Edaphochlamys debaryana]|eukprot:KAG2495675.1 hypothetical protein HYH03_006275 [Edaphochlamys debaryana]